MVRTKQRQEINNRWQEQTEELYKKGLNDLDNHEGVVTHLEPDILECEIKQAFGSFATNKTTGADELFKNLNLPELLKILKDDAVKVLHSIRQKIWKTQQQSQDWKRSVFIPIPKDNDKECSNYCTIGLIPHCQQGNAQNLSSQASAVCEPVTSRSTSWIQKRQRNQRSNCQHLLDHRKSKEVAEKHLTLFP